MDSLILLSNVRVAGTPTFFPNADPKKHRCLVTVIKNRGKNNAGQEMTDEFSLVFWGKYAQIACLHLEVGRAINIEGVARSWSVDTGRVKANSKKEIYRLTNIHVKSMEFVGDSMKKQVQIINSNLQRAKAEGLIPMETTITPEYLLMNTRPSFVDYNPAIAEQTGMYGQAKVYIKGRGFIGPASTGTSVPAGNLDANAQLEQLKQELATLKAGGAETGDGTVVDPFAGAAGA